MKSRSGGLALIISGLILGAVLVGYGLWRIAAPESPEAASIVPPPKTQLQTVVIARQEILRGQSITAADLDTLQVETASSEGFLAQPQLAVGKVALQDIAPRQIVLRGAVSETPGRAGLAFLVPPGHRAISLDANDEIAVANLLRPGDRVDVELVLPESVVAGAGSDGADRSEARTLIQDVEVLAVGQQVSDAPPAEDKAGEAAADRRRGRTITLALRTDDVPRFTLGRSLGRVYLTLRPPQDPTLPQAAQARLAALRGGVSPAPARPASAAPAARSPRPTIALTVAGERRTLVPGGQP